MAIVSTYSRSTSEAAQISERGSSITAHLPTHIKDPSSPDYLAVWLHKRAGVAEAAALPSEGALQVGWVKRTLQALRFLYQRHERARHLLQAGSSGGHVCWLRRPEDASEVPEMQVDSQWWR